MGPAIKKKTKKTKQKKLDLKKLYKKSRNYPKTRIHIQLLKISAPL